MKIELKPLCLLKLLLLNIYSLQGCKNNTLLKIQIIK
jgi:hypothetical protein